MKFTPPVNSWLLPLNEGKQIEQVAKDLYSDVTSWQIIARSNADKLVFFKGNLSKYNRLNIPTNPLDYA